MSEPKEKISAAVAGNALGMASILKLDELFESDDHGKEITIKVAGIISIAAMAMRLKRGEKMLKFLQGYIGDLLAGAEMVKSGELVIEREEEIPMPTTGSVPEC